MKYKNQKLIFTLIILGIIIRFSLMLCGHNFDFESYCIVGKLASAFKNVYANTTRYNYGFIFFCVQGLFYKLSFGNETVYRILIVSLLTLADLGIACIIADKKIVDIRFDIFLYDRQSCLYRCSNDIDILF